MDIAQIKTSAIVPALMLASLPAATVSMPPAPMVRNAHFSMTMESLPVEDKPATENSIVMRESADKWTKAMARRFEELTILEALGTISKIEFQELEALSVDRRNLQHPRTAEEVLWEFKQRQITAQLIDAVREYATFHSADPKRIKA